MKTTLSLMYHCVYSNNNKLTGFQNKGAFDYKISDTIFRKQVEAISTYLNENSIKLVFPIFTFDDGGVSFYENIAPICEEYNHKCIFFISTKFIGTKGFLTSKQIANLHKRGHIIAAHSHSHPDDMSLLSDYEINQEWGKSINILSEIIDDSIEYASVPNGFNSKSIIKSAKKNGIKYLFTSEPTTKIKEYNEIVCIGRYAVRANMKSEFALSIVTDNFSRMKLHFRWLLIGVLKRLLGRVYLKVRTLVIKK